MFKTATHTARARSNQSSVFHNENRSETFIQPKLNVGKPGDKYEIEADHMADTVLARKNEKRNPFFSPVPSIQKQRESETKEETNVENEIQEKPIVEINSSLVKTKPKEERGIQEKPITEIITPLIQQQTEEDQIQKCGDCEKDENSIQKKTDNLDSTSEIINKPNENQVTISTVSSLQKQTTEERIEDKEKEEVEEESLQLKEKTVQAKCEACEEENVQRKPNTDSSISVDFENSLSQSKGGGNPMPLEVRNEMESGFGADFSNVRIHTDSNAIQMNQQLGAQAFANGNDIYFNEGKFNTATNNGQHLLAHELTHTIQQTGGQSRNTNVQPMIQMNFLDNIPGVSRARRFLRSAVSRVMSVGRRLARPIQTIISSVRSAIVSLIRMITAPIRAMINEAIQWIDDGLRSILASVCNGFCNGFLPFISRLNSIYNRAKNILSTIFSFLSTIWTSFTNLLNSVLSRASQIISNTFNWINQRLRRIWNTVRRYIPSLGAMVTRAINFIRGLYNQARQLVINSFRWVREKYNAIKQWIKERLSFGTQAKDNIVRYLEQKYPDKLDQIRKVIHFFHDLTRVDWMGPFNTTGLKADWGRMFFIWFCELSPADLGIWSRNGDAATVTITEGTGPEYIYDLRNKPYHLRAMNQFRAEYPDFESLEVGNHTRSGFRFTGEGTATGNYNQLEWFLGSYGIDIEVVGVNHDTKQVFVRVTVSNTSHWESATRIPQRGMDAGLPPSLVSDMPREDCGPGGDFAQLFIWQETINYDGSDIDPEHPDCTEIKSTSRRLPNISLFDKKEFRKGWGRATESVPIFRAVIDTEDYGIIIIEAEALSQLLAEIMGEAGPGTLRNIIINMNPCDSEHQGEAELHIPLALIGQLTLDGIIHGRAMWNCLSALGLEGTLRPIGRGTTSTAFLGKVKVRYKEGEISFEHEATLEDICMKLTFMLNAVLEVLLFDRFSIFEKTWQLHEKEWEKCWSLDALIDVKRNNGNTDFDISFKDDLTDIGPLLQWLFRIGGLPGRFPMLPLDADEQMDESGDPCATRPGRPGTRDNPLWLTWPKRPSRLYPTLYFGGRIDRPKKQSRLKALHTQGRNDETGTRVKEYKPHRTNVLANGEVIGIGGGWRISSGTIVGPQKEEGAGGTPGGRKINRLLKRYGFYPSLEGKDGDHVWEMQIGGQDTLPNLWPLDSGENQRAGGKLYNSYVTYPDTGRQVPFRELLRRRKKYYFKIKGFNY